MNPQYLFNKLVIQKAMASGNTKQICWSDRWGNMRETSVSKVVFQRNLHYKEVYFFFVPAKEKKMRAFLVRCGGENRRRRKYQILRFLFQNNSGTKGFQSLLQLLRLFLGDALLDNLWHALDELLGLLSTKMLDTCPIGWHRKKTKCCNSTSTKFIPVRFLTSRITFALAAGSIFSSLTLNSVFSAGFSSSTGAAAPPVGAEGMATGMAISWMLRRVCNITDW